MRPTQKLVRGRLQHGEFIMDANDPLALLKHTCWRCTEMSALLSCQQKPNRSYMASRPTSKTKLSLEICLVCVDGGCGVRAKPSAVRVTTFIIIFNTKYRVIQKARNQA